jgi:hypothetical protein
MLQVWPVLQVPPAQQSWPAPPHAAHRFVVRSQTNGSPQTSPLPPL